MKEVERQMDLLSSSHSSVRLSSLVNSKQELRQCRNLETGAEAEAVEDTVYWLGLACFLIESRTISLGMAPTTVGWALQH